MTDWPFTEIELTAGLRRYLADPRLNVTAISEEYTPVRLPSTCVRGLGIDVARWGHSEHYSYILTLPRPVRLGLPGAGRREIGFLRNVTLSLPVARPELVAADPRAGWIILEPYPTELPPAEWTANEYRQAVINLAGFHDQFWGLDEDLAVYPWVAFPLGKDMETVCLAAAQAVEKIVRDGLSPVLCSSIERMSAVAHLLTQADSVAAMLRSAPQTLLHGDYWPANIFIDEDERHVVYDWQVVSVGPGVLDLANFIVKSQIHYGPLPVDVNELIWLYRYTLATQAHNVWDEAEWQRLWDSALMWRFLQEQLPAWGDAVEPDTPECEARIEKLWLEPVVKAVDQHLEKYALI